MAEMIKMKKMEEMEEMEQMENCHLLTTALLTRGRGKKVARSNIKIVVGNFFPESNVFSNHYSSIRILTEGHFVCRAIVSGGPWLGKK